MLTDYLKLAVVTLAVLACSKTSNAQSLSAPLNEAKARLVCGAGTLVSAKYIPGGLLEVTCQQNTTGDTTPTELQGTELTTANTTLGATAALFGLSVLVGDSNSGTTTTTTTN
ncbi:hypothetical protein DL239_12035 [Sedimentitalea sp. CY04]|uniref:Spore coat protein U domain-containing protein n=1 Tax=Parasedimentitalea denitrificans TaxID=2211118 RepID=A0ABX0WA77_9RHOB|nr:hypothetical protein [Sedimentitalea sp. CY04]